MSRGPGSMGPGAVSAASAEVAAIAVSDEDEGASARIWIARLIFLLTFLGVWEACAGRFFDTFWTSSPSEILKTLGEWIESGLLWRHLGVTFQETAAGFISGSILAIVLAALVGQNETVRRTLDPFVTALYGVPKVALAPLFIMWFGIGMAPKIVLAGVSVFFLVFFNTLGGVKEVDRRLIEAMQTMGASRFDIQTKLIFPASLPWIFLGLKLGLPYGFIGAVAAEMMAANSGIGFLTQQSAGQFNTAGVFAALLALMIVTTLLNEVLGLIEKRLFRWR